MYKPINIIIKTIIIILPDPLSNIGTIFLPNIYIKPASKKNLELLVTAATKIKIKKLK